MTSVYSGGLVYEYSEEGSGYGLVELNGNSVSPTTDFKNLQSALSKYQPPSDDGGYKSSGAASQCPAQSSTWEVSKFTGADLPAIPDGAVKYLDGGAGDGPGLNGDGSMWDKAGASDSTASPGSGLVSSATGGGSSSSSSSAGTQLAFSPLVCGAVILGSILFGLF